MSCSKKHRKHPVLQAARLTVIGAGWSRTGTKSLEAALIRLGHKAYGADAPFGSLFGGTAINTRFEESLRAFKA